MFSLNRSALDRAKRKRKGRTMVKVRRKRATARRRSKARKTNPWYNDRPGHRRAAVKGWRKRRRKTRKGKRTRASYVRAAKKAAATRRRNRRAASARYYRTRTGSYIRTNPGPARRRRRARRNPSPRSFMRTLTSQQFIMNAVTMGAGIAGGFVLMPVAVRLIPPKYREQVRPYAGGLNVLIGALMYTMMRNKSAKQIGMMVVGTGVYDLIARNISQLNLPTVQADVLVNKLFPEESVAASYGVPVRPVSRIAAGRATPAGVGLSYYPGMAASYQSAGKQTQGLPAMMGSSDLLPAQYDDDPYSGVSW